MRVMFRGKLVPSIEFEPTVPPTKPRCLQCLDVGYIPELVDDDRPLEAVPCSGCKMFCTRCDRYVLREGHQCL